MISHRRRLAMLAGTAALVTLSVSDASAGGFALREQSAYGQGLSFAGIAAGGSLSSMFWNPAVMTQFPVMQSEMVFTGILPYADHTVTTSTLPYPGAPNSGAPGLVPSSYFTYQLTSNIWLGVSVSAPFGLAVTFPDVWAGRTYAERTSLKTYNATPSFAVRLNDWISLGAGVQIQYAKADLWTGIGATPGLQANIAGSGWAYGFTAGVTLTPTPSTTIGLGWRSGLDQKIEGTLLTTAPVPFTTAGAATTTVKLPDVVSLGIRQRINQQWMVMGTVEWSNWSRIGTSTILQASGAPSTIGTFAVTLPFQYSDGWFFSLGAEYKWTEQTTLRAGVGYEISPITDSVRTPRLPDNDRIWLSTGLTHHIMKGLSLDLAYTYLIVRDTPINISAASGNPWFNPGAPVTYIGNVDAHVHIFAVAFKYRFDQLLAGPM